MPIYHGNNQYDNSNAWWIFHFGQPNSSSILLSFCEMSPLQHTSNVIDRFVLLLILPSPDIYIYTFNLAIHKERSSYVGRDAPSRYFLLVANFINPAIHFPKLSFLLLVQTYYFFWAKKAKKASWSCILWPLNREMSVHPMSRSRGTRKFHVTPCHFEDLS